jgi:hypothetical protein
MDTGGRNPADALGSWLAELVQDASITELRCQTGFFGVDGLGYLAPLISTSAESHHVVRLLVGSNDGVTRRVDLETLLELVGSPRQGLDLGVVSFANGFFHPKTVHFKRSDGSMAAYVGSANITRSGVSSLNVEAGITMDSNDGDAQDVLTQIAAAVDWWFEEPRSGLFPVRGLDDIDNLVKEGVLGIQRPPSPRAGGSGGKTVTTLPRLAPLVSVPGLSSASVAEVSEPPPEDDEPHLPAVVTVEAEWSKKLSASDAQRKLSGNQRGSITLVQNRHPIDAQTYFRHEFYGSAAWIGEQTRTGESRESAIVPMLVSIDGLNIGMQDIHVTHASNREAGQHNYTSLIHLGPLAPYFAAEDMTGRLITLQRRSDGSFSLVIAAA